MQDLEIFVSDYSAAKVKAWLERHFGTLQVESQDKDVITYKSPRGPITITNGVGDSDYTSVWMNIRQSPWEDDAACARDAFAALGCSVRCDPGDDAEPDHFLEISGKGENLIVWDDN